MFRVECLMRFRGEMKQPSAPASHWGGEKNEVEKLERGKRGLEFSERMNNSDFRTGSRFDWGNSCFDSEFEKGLA